MPVRQSSGLLPQEIAWAEEPTNYCRISRASVQLFYKNFVHHVYTTCLVVACILRITGDIHQKHRWMSTSCSLRVAHQHLRAAEPLRGLLHPARRRPAPSADRSIASARVSPRMWNTLSPAARPRSHHMQVLYSIRHFGDMSFTE
jgi:hypothetical protein